MGGLVKRVRAIVNRRLRATAVVLMYHRVADDGWDPFGLCVSADRFGAQLRELTARYPVLSLAAVEEGLAAGRVPAGVAITFDDGYVDNLRLAAPILASAGVPWTVFVTAGELGRSFWWDRVAHAMREQDGPVSDLELTIGGVRRRWRLGNGAARAAAVVEIAAELRRIGARERDSVVEQLESWSGRRLPADCRAMSASEVVELGNDSHAEIGGHTLTHPSLAGCSPDEQRREIAGGREALERVLGRAVTRFAYPFGARQDWNAATQALVREAGYCLAVTTRAGVVGGGTDPYAVPRFAVRNWEPAEFARRVDDFFGSRRR